MNMGFATSFGLRLSVEMILRRGMWEIQNKGRLKSNISNIVISLQSVHSVVRTMRNFTNGSTKRASTSDEATDHSNTRFLQMALQLTVVVSRLELGYAEAACV